MGLVWKISFDGLLIAQATSIALEELFLPGILRLTHYYVPCAHEVMISLLELRNLFSYAYEVIAVLE